MRFVSIYSSFSQRTPCQLFGQDAGDHASVLMPSLGNLALVSPTSFRSRLAESLWCGRGFEEHTWHGTLLIRVHLSTVVFTSWHRPRQPADRLPDDSCGGIKAECLLPIIKQPSGLQSWRMPIAKNPPSPATPRYGCNGSAKNLVVICVKLPHQASLQQNVHQRATVAASS